jgi:hypothetical protein
MARARGMVRLKEFSQPISHTENAAHPTVRAAVIETETVLLDGTSPS